MPLPMASMSLATQLQLGEQFEKGRLLIRELLVVTIKQWSGLRAGASHDQQYLTSHGVAKQFSPAGCCAREVHGPTAAYCLAAAVLLVPLWVAAF